MAYFILIVSIAMMIPLGTVSIKTPRFILGCLDFLEGNRDFNPFHNVKQIFAHWFFLMISMTAYFQYSDALKTSEYSINLEVLIMALIIIIFAIMSVAFFSFPRKFKFYFNNSLTDIYYNICNHYASDDHRHKISTKGALLQSGSETGSINTKVKFIYKNGIPFLKNTQPVGAGSSRSVIKKYAIKHFLLFTYSLKAAYPKLNRDRCAFVSRYEGINEGTFYQAYKEVQKHIDKPIYIEKNQSYYKEALDIIPVGFEKERNIIIEYLRKISRKA